MSDRAKEFINLASPQNVKRKSFREVMMLAGKTDRAVLFIDGNNWYHYLKRSVIPDLFRLDYAKIRRS